MIPGRAFTLARLGSRPNPFAIAPRRNPCWERRRAYLGRVQVQVVVLLKVKLMLVLLGKHPRTMLLFLSPILERVHD